MKKNVTMRDIAARLDVSTVTVSKALSNKDGVSEELREKIKEVADSMGYRYNSLAKGMKEGRSYNVGIIIAERYVKDDAFYLKMYQSAVKSLAKVNYYGIMEIISRKTEKDLIMPNMISDNKVDGIIILGQMNSDYVDIIKEAAIPIVFLDFYDEHLDVDSIISDNVYGAYILTNYLISQGHKEIGFIGDIFATSSILDRYLGYYKALLANGIHLKEEWIIKDRDDAGSFIDIALPKQMPTAFVCNCDEVAYIFIKQLKKAGFKVPEDVSVVGFDNYIFANLSSPKLTTIEVDIDNMADTAVDAVIKKIQEENFTLGRKVISGHLIIRDSVSVCTK